MKPVECDFIAFSLSFNPGIPSEIFSSSSNNNLAASPQSHFIDSLINVSNTDLRTYICEMALKVILRLHWNVRIHAAETGKTRKLEAK